ncbi:hypothetical protein F5Y15DRAFT_408988 [Xylariaceae sp. FL0016]|nr:hypothetical protein F5Y15DRAFT_408988 [Xylariaceae sp. FL0016]
MASGTASVTDSSRASCSAATHSESNLAQEVSESGVPELDNDLSTDDQTSEYLSTRTTSYMPSLEVDDVDDVYGSIHMDTTSIYSPSHYPSISAPYRVERPWEEETLDSTRSITDLDLDYVIENGRRYCGSYYMPNDEDEQVRLQLINQVYLKAFEGELTSIPLECPTHILDIGTAAGEWAIDMAEAYPECEITGTDISNIFERQAPPNVFWEIDDAELDWERPVDYYDLGMRNFYSFFEPGSLIHKMAQDVQEASIMSGKPRGTGHLEPRFLVNAGYVDVQLTEHAIPLRTEDGSTGKFWLLAMLNGIESTCLRLLTKHKGWKAEDVRIAADMIGQEMMSMALNPRRAKGFVVKVRVLTGRKPGHYSVWSTEPISESGEVMKPRGSRESMGEESRGDGESGYELKRCHGLLYSAVYLVNQLDDVAAANGMAGLSLDLADEGGALPIFDVERVRLEFGLAADFVAAQVANNVLVLALSNGRILRIDLNRPEDIDDIDLPKRVSEVGVIRQLFLDPTASHLIICTSLSENYYLHTQSRQPRPLVAWNPSSPTSSTREILVGAADGNVYETYIEPSNEFYRREEKYLKVLHKLPDGAVSGLWVDDMGGKGGDVRRVVIATQSRVFHLVGRVGRSGHEGSGSIYTKLFDGEKPVVHEVSRGPAAAPSMLSVSPDPPNTDAYDDVGVFHGKLLTVSVPATNEIGNKITSSEAAGRRKSTADFIDAIVLTQWHVVSLVGGRVVATNRLTGSVIYDQVVLDQGQRALGLYVDQQKNTFWLFTTQEIFEIVVRDEERDIWKIMLQRQQFDTALQYASTPAQRDAVATASGDYLAEKGAFVEAAGVYGKSSKPFEDVALAFIDNGQNDALRKYLLTKINTYKKSYIMQRMMIATWLVEVFMAKLNSLEDTIQVEAEGVENGNHKSRDELDAIRTEFHNFVNKHKADLDRKTTYDVISSHAREEELLFFANAINDYNYELSYWVQRERWTETLNVLKKQTDPDVFYRYSSVLMTHVGHNLVEILMRQSKLEPRKIIPALLDYNRNFGGPLKQNQAIRYLQFVINQLQSTDPAVHNTLVSMYASHESKDESGLLAYLESQGDEPNFDPDFALRLCIQHKRTLSCVHIYTNMGQYVQAVDLALSHNQVDYAAIIADRPMSNPALRKKLWLAVARKVISQSDGIKTAIAFLKRCDLLKIEDLIPFFPDFVVIDDFKEEICAALEDYGRSIEGLRKEMDEAGQTAGHIKMDIAALDQRYAIVEPGEKCYVCGLPLLSQQFFVFPCQHAFHSDCLGRKVLEQAGVGKSRRIRECQVSISKGLVSGAAKEAMVAELDALVAGACILCSDYAIKRIDEPFVGPDDDKNEWAL